MKQINQIHNGLFYNFGNPVNLTIVRKYQKKVRLFVRLCLTIICHATLEIVLYVSALQFYYRARYLLCLQVN